MIRRWTSRRIRRSTALVILTCAAGASLLLLIPVVHFEAPLSTTVYDRGGELLGAAIAEDEQWRFPSPDHIPEKYRIALIQFEDRRFFSHSGVDLLALVRAACQNLAAGRVISGGSTITMQVVRLARPPCPRTLYRKMIEAVLAIRLEMVRSKEDILRLYATHAPYGGNVVGLEAASWRYFGRAPDQLSWAETAMLVVLPNSPSLIHPGRNRDLLLTKRNRLLDTLQAQGVFDEQTCSLAKLEPLPPEPLPVPALAPHLLARARLEGNGSRSVVDDPCRTGARINTTLDRDVQLKAVDIVKRQHERLVGNGVFNAAAMILEVNSGQVIAYVGNLHDFTDQEHGNHVDMVTAARSTGSILKPILFGAMLEAGEVLPNQLIPDIPTRIDGFSPENYDRSFRGAVPAATALAKSLNVPAVRMLRSYGVNRFCALLRRMGITTLHRRAEDYGLTLILGGAECSLWEIVSLYAGMARTVNQYSAYEDLGEPFRSPVYRLPEKAQRPQGKDLDKVRNRGGFSSQGARSLVGVGACYETLKAMLEVNRPGAEGAWRSYASFQRIAWKTGTSYGHRDAWAVGVTPRYAVGVWVGNADGEGRPGLTGHDAAAPILFDLFGLLDTGGWFDFPDPEMQEVEICGFSGMRKSPNCEKARLAFVPRSALPGLACPYCRLVHCDSTLTWQVDSNCESVAGMRTIPWFVLPPVMEWYYKRVYADYRPLPPYRTDCGSSGTGLASLSCVFPEDGSVIYIPLELDGRRGRTVFKAAHRRHRTRVFWHMDQQYYGETQGIHEMAVLAEPGDHVLTLVDEAGEQLRRRFTILSKE